MTLHCMGWWNFKAKFHIGLPGLKPSPLGGLTR